MIAYIQLWNQTLWPWMKQAEQARITRAGATFIGRWSCGIRRHYEIEARVYIFRARDHHGIVASGYVLDKPLPEEDFDDSGCVWWYVPIEFDVVLDPNDILPRGPGATIRGDRAHERTGVRDQGGAEREEGVD